MCKPTCISLNICVNIPVLVYICISLQRPNLHLQGLDGRAFFGINFSTPVLTSTVAGITATAMFGATGCFTSLKSGHSYAKP